MSGLWTFQKAAALIPTQPRLVHSKPVTVHDIWLRLQQPPGLPGLGSINGRLFGWSPNNVKITWVFGYSVPEPNSVIKLYVEQGNLLYVIEPELLRLETSRVSSSREKPAFTYCWNQDLHDPTVGHLVNLKIQWSHNEAFYNLRGKDLKLRYFIGNDISLKESVKRDNPTLCDTNPWSVDQLPRIINWDQHVDHMLSLALEHLPKPS